MVLRILVVRLNACRYFRLVENRGKIKALCLPVIDRRPRVEHIDATNHFIDRAEAKLRHQFANFLRQHEEEINDVLRLAGKTFTKLGVLRGNADWAGVEMTLPHHDAADHYQRCSGNAVFFRTQHRGDDNIFGRANHAVGLHNNPAAKVVHHKHLMGLSKPQLPRQAGVHDLCLGAGPSATIVT